jgi:hypothetical protein
MLSAVRFVSVGLAVLLGAAVACSKSEDGLPAQSEACSTGPAYPFEMAFAQLDTPTPNAPECIPRCGVQKDPVSAPFGPAWTLKALPSGSCSNIGERCTMTAVRERECPDGTVSQCSLTPYECRCDGASWTCLQGPKGASACICPLDAGPDASP